MEITWTAAIRQRKDLAIKRADLPQIDGVSHLEPSFARAITNHSPSCKPFAQLQATRAAANQSPSRKPFAQPQNGPAQGRAKSARAAVIAGLA